MCLQRFGLGNHEGIAGPKELSVVRRSAANQAFEITGLLIVFTEIDPTLVSARSI
jgi:hypothetical protein